MTTKIMSSYAGRLSRKLVDLIQVRGPVTVADYMKMVLTYPESGFYMDRDVFGAKGHFTTSPEISQIFGEICGVWILNEWQRFNFPKPLRIVELGPGRGTLMLDIARTINQFNKSREVASLHMVEISPYLTQVQEETLCGTTSLIGSEPDNELGAKHNSLTKTGLPVTWYRHLDQLDETSGFTAFVAHEFFDALPVHKFVRDMRLVGRPWRELLVDIDAETHDFRFVISKNETPASRLLVTNDRLKDVPGEQLEICPEAALHVQKISDRLNRAGNGCMLMCDYGFHAGQEGPDKDRDTFRAFREHKQWPPLKEPGTADLTADVDFDYLKDNLQNKALAFGPVKQSDFLWKCGISLRLQALMKNATEEQKSELTSGVNMLVNDMGQRYKFMALFPRGTESMFDGNPPAGFD